MACGVEKDQSLYKNQREFPTFDSFSDTLAEATEDLMNNTLATEDEAAVNCTQIARDNVAGIRATSNIEHIGDNLSDVLSDNHDSDGTLNLRYSYLTSTSKTAKDNEADTAHDFLSCAAKTIGVEAKAERIKYKQAQSRQSSAPSMSLRMEIKRCLVVGQMCFFLERVAAW